MNISRNNIEKWFFDYFEGNLSQSQTKQLFQFLDEHPWHAEEFNNWKNTYHVPAHAKHSFPGKASLVKNTPVSDYLKYAAAFLLIFSLGGLTTYLVIESDTFIEGNIVAQSEKFDWDKHVETYRSSESLNSSESLTNIRESSYSSAQDDGVQKTSDQINDSQTAAETVVNNQSNTSVASKSESDDNDNNPLDNNTATNSSEVQSTSVNANEIGQDAEQEIETIPESSSSTSINSLNSDAKFLSAEGGVATNRGSEMVNITQEQESILNEAEEDYALVSAVNQIVDEDLASRYLSNPNVESQELDLKFNDLGLKRTSKLKKLSKSLMRMLDDPIALTNLRDPNLIIPQYNPLQFNAAFAGSIYKGRWETMHRYQWHNAANAQHTTVSSFDGYVSQIKGGVGILASFSDLNAGMYRDYELSLAYSPKVRVSKNISIEPGINFNVGTKTLNSSKFNGQMIEWDRGHVHQVYDSPEDVPGTIKLYRDIGAGVLLNTKWFYAGFHGNNLLEHQDNIYNSTEAGVLQTAPKRYTVVIGTDYQSFSNPYLIVSPFVSFEQLGERQELWAGTHFRWNSLIAGASISNHLDYKGMLGFQHKSFRISYSYDETYSLVASTRIPSHELNIKVVMGKDYVQSQIKRY